MPTYAMTCDCGHSYEEFRWFSEGEPEACPVCAEPNGEKFHQNWPVNRPGGWTYGEDHATTVGQQAQYNARRLGKEQVEKKVEESRNRKRKAADSVWNQIPGARVVDPTDELPWYRDGSMPGLPKMERPLDLNQVRDVNKYIEEGVTT